MKELTTTDMTQIALSTAMLSLSAFIAIPIGPVPVTLQVFFFLIIPALLGPYKGTIALSLYVLLGLLGLPVFAGGSGGFQTILSPSFGYLLGQVILAPLVGYIGTKKKGASMVHLTSYMVAVIMLLYVVGMSYQYWVMNTVLSTPISFQAIVAGNVFVFLPLDILKASTAAIIYNRIHVLIAA